MYSKRATLKSVQDSRGYVGVDILAIVELGLDSKVYESVRFYDLQIMLLQVFPRHYVNGMNHFVMTFLSYKNEF